MNREKYFYELGIDNIISFMTDTVASEKERMDLKRSMNAVKNILMRNYDLINISDKLRRAEDD